MGLSDERAKLKRPGAVETVSSSGDYTFLPRFVRGREITTLSGRVIIHLNASLFGESAPLEYAGSQRDP